MNATKLILLQLVIFVFLTASHAQAGERKLSFAVSGIVAAINVRVGDRVEVGTVLAVLDKTPFIARKRATQAAATSARLVLDHAEVKLTQVLELFDALSNSKEDVEKAEAAHAKARADYERARARAEIVNWRLQRATLLAPFAGSVSSVPGYPGLIINTKAGNPPVVVIKTR